MGGTAMTQHASPAGLRRRRGRVASALRSAPAPGILPRAPVYRGHVGATLVIRWGVLVALALAASACGPPISVRRVPARQVSAELARSALNSTRPSLWSENALYRRGLTGRFEREPEVALAELRGSLGGWAENSTLFALAELSFLHAEKSHRREHYLASVVYAWAFLFPESASDRPEEFDPRLRIAADLYNLGLTRAFASRDGANVELHSGAYPLPFGSLAVEVDEASLVWANRGLFDFVPVAELEVRGLGARFRSAGIGAPLAASLRWPDDGSSERDFVASAMKLPVTAVLRIEEPRRQVRGSEIESSLRVYSHYDADGVEIGDTRVPLEAEPTATLAYTLSQLATWNLEVRGFLRGEIITREIEDPIAFIEPYRPGRIPVVFVHGTASNPGRWGDMLNVLSNNRRLRGRFQYWFFFFGSGNAIPYSAMRLRQALTDVVQRVDPEGRDPALRQMVVVGHSQGGLLTRMTAISSGDRFWDSLSSRPIDELDVSEETRGLLRQVFFFEPLPFVRRVVFLGTPHRGSFFAENWFISQVARFVQLPQTLGGAIADVVQGNPDALRFDPRRPALGSVYGMRPGSPLVNALQESALDPGVKAHSIIPILGDLPPQGQSDGIVDFESASIDGVVSELIVPRSGHSVQSNPVAIEEVRRILLEHADQVCAECQVACGEPLARRRVVAEPTPNTPEEVR